MAITVVNYSSAGLTTNGTFTITPPVGTQAGDLLVMLVGTRNASSNPSATTFTYSYDSLSNQGSYNGGVLSKIATSSEPANYTVTVPGPGEAMLVAFRGVDNTTPFDIAFSGTTALQTWTTSLTTVTANAMLLIGCSGNTTAASTTQTCTNSTFAPIGTVTNGGKTTNVVLNGMMCGVKATAGSTGSFTYDGGMGTSQMWYFGVALRPATTGGTTSATRTVNWIMDDGE